MAALVNAAKADLDDEIVELSWESPARRLGEASVDQVPEQLHVRFRVNGSDVESTVTLNRALLPSNMRHVLHHPDGRLEDGPLPQHCFYIGMARGATGSGPASFSTCQGGFSGMLLLGKQAFLVEPSPGLRAARGLRETTGSAPHGVRRLQEEEALDMFGDVQSFVAPPGLAARRLTGATTKYVEVVVVNDNSRYTAFGGQNGLADLAAHSSSVMNAVTSIYRAAPMNVTLPYTIQIVLVAQHTFLQPDPYESTVSTWGGETELNSLLSAFLGWTSKEMSAGNLSPNDNRILLSGRDFQGSTVGYAGVSAMCSVARSGSISMCGSSLGRCSAVVAHEMGHNFGMGHDGSNNNGCATSGNIMEAVAGGPTPDKFSGCSVTYITNFFNSVYPRSTCLENKPTQVFGDPVCQNGFVEKGEDCDCGSADCSALDPCCDGATCTFASPSYQCSDVSQGCCLNCMNVSASANRICRAAQNSCDLPEICPGGTAECPTDVYVYPGQPCRASSDPSCSSATSSLDCPNFRCTWTGSACQVSSDPWEGPLATDIPGLGVGGSSASTLEECKQTCLHTASCVAIQYSATDVHEGKKCFVHSSSADTGAQYLTFQVYKFHRVTEFAGLCSLGSCWSMDYTCSVDVNRDFSGSWDMSKTCAEYNDDCNQMICHKAEYPSDPTQCGQNFAVHDKQMPVPDGTPCWHPSTPKGTRSGMCVLGNCTLASRLAVVSTCGNGGIDYGEQCDCGSSADPCCDCSRCLLRSGKQCSSHEACCDSSTCMFKASGTICRAAGDPCDEAENCTGTSARCPVDVGKPVGTSCPGTGGLEATCYAKRCVTSLHSQCSALTGGVRPFAKQSIEGGHPRTQDSHQCTALNCCTSCDVISGNVVIAGVRYTNPSLCNSCQRLTQWSTFSVRNSDGTLESNTIYLGAAEDGTMLQNNSKVCIRAVDVAMETSCGPQEFLEASIGRCLGCDNACSTCVGPSLFDCVGACAYGDRDSRGACPLSLEQASAVPTPASSPSPSPASSPSPGSSPASSPSPGEGMADSAQASSSRIAALAGILLFVLLVRRLS